MITAVPSPIAVTTPEVVTVATELLLDDQVTDLLAASDGVMVAVSVKVSPFLREAEVLLRVTEVTEFAFHTAYNSHWRFLHTLHRHYILRCRSKKLPNL